MKLNLHPPNIGPGNKIRTLVWASLQASVGSGSLPALMCVVRWSEAHRLPVPHHQNFDEGLKRGDARHIVSLSLCSGFSVMAKRCIGFLIVLVCHQFTCMFFSSSIW